MTTTQDRATAVDPASGRPPVAAPAAGYVGALIALLILAVDAPGILEKLGLKEHLTPQRSNGVRSMVARIRREAERALAPA